MSIGCEKCNYTGYISEVINNENVLKNCECKDKHEKVFGWEEKLKEARIPRDYWNLNLEQYENYATNDEEIMENQVSVDKVKKYIFSLAKMVKIGQGLYLSGENNSGKTMMMCCILKKAIQFGFSTKFLTLAEVVQTYMDFWFKPEEDKPDLSILKEVDILGVDDCFDLQKTFVSQSRVQVTQIDDLFRYRTSNWKSNIITSNLPMEKVEGVMNRSILECLKRKVVELRFYGNISMILQRQLRGEE